MCVCGLGLRQLSVGPVCMNEVYIYVCAFVCICAYVFMCVPACICVYLCMCICVYLCVSVCICVYLCICVYACMCGYVWIRVDNVCLCGSASSTQLMDPRVRLTGLAT